jgi:alginate O-acetyltransferase complex protein AlgI
MLFPAPVFLFAFLPAVLLLHAVLPRPARNGLLLAASLLFYAWGGVATLPVLLASILANWGFGRWIAGCEGRRRDRALGLGVAANLILLGAFKYLDFLAGALGLPGAGLPLPPGISFFTFHALSYLIDVARGSSPAQRRLADFALYISFFPQLIAGPIIRYRDIAAQLAARRADIALFASGVERFILGLAKKVLLADPLGAVADTVFATPAGELGLLPAWLGLVCYALQIYLDFSGYSDMAIGLGRMFGFRFLENFRYPYSARSVTEFWRRWHISLSRWFRDYLYIPLGGNRRGLARTTCNLGIVFLLCGLWHGASWNFLLWGAIHGAALGIERAGFGDLLRRAPAGFGHLWTLAWVLFAWVFFRAADLPQALAMLAALAGSEGFGLATARRLADNQVLLALAWGAMAATPLLARAASDWRQRAAQFAGRTEPPAPEGPGPARLVMLHAVLLLALAAIAGATHTPFLYFRF